MRKHLPKLSEKCSSNAPSMDVASSSQEPLRLGHVIGIIAIHKSLGYLIPMGHRQLIRGLGARRRTATGIILTTVAVLLIAWGCVPEPTPSEEVVAAGNIAKCSTEGDEATARLVEGIDGTVLALGDEAYPRGSAANFEECYGPSWGWFKGRTKPVPGNHEYYTKGPETTSSTSGRPQATPREVTTPMRSDPGTWWPSTATARRSAVGRVPLRRGGLRRTSPPTRRRGAPSLICIIRSSVPGRS